MAELMKSMTYEQIMGCPENSFPRRSFFRAQVNALRDIRVREGVEAVEEALAGTLERDGQETVDRLRAALAARDRRAS
jgi:hypothetical protein